MSIIITGNADPKEAQAYVDYLENKEELDASLTDKQKETLEKFEECMNEMHSITERDAFSYGFRLGVQLMAEAFLLPMGENDD